MEWEYSPAPESSAIADIKDRYLPFIDGTFKEGNGEDRGHHQSRNRRAAVDSLNGQRSRHRPSGQRRPPGL